MLNPKGIDEPIRDVIVKMNKLGFKTASSCAGYYYADHPANSAPFISFKSSLKKTKLLLESLREAGAGGWVINLGYFNKYHLVFSPQATNSGTLSKWRKNSWKELRKALWWVEFGRQEMKRRRKICPGGPVLLQPMEGKNWHSTLRKLEDGD